MRLQVFQLSVAVRTNASAINLSVDLGMITFLLTIVVIFAVVATTAMITITITIMVSIVGRGWGRKRLTEQVLCKLSGEAPMDCSVFHPLMAQLLRYARQYQLCCPGGRQIRPSCGIGKCLLDSHPVFDGVDGIVLEFQLDDLHEASGIARFEYAEVATSQDKVCCANMYDELGQIHQLFVRKGFGAGEGFGVDGDIRQNLHDGILIDLGFRKPISDGAPQPAADHSICYATAFSFPASSRIFSISRIGTRMSLPTLTVGISPRAAAS